MVFSSKKIEIGLALLAGFFLGAAVLFLSLKGPSDDGPDEKRLGGYKYTNPLLNCDAGMQWSIRPFKDKIARVLEKNRGGTAYTSVYYRDLNNGPWFGINEREEFSPASLLKVPLMMSILKNAEIRPALLAEKVVFDKDGDYEAQMVKPEKTIKAGDALTVDELIYRMIVYSDNNAQTALFKLIGDPEVARTYSDLGLDVPSFEKQENFMSVKNYASFFRVLFNASYLRKEVSERALELLTRVGFREGIRSGVPENIAVAHKFGERITETGEKQFHDCGIVYHPDHPYLLCVMNRGDNMNEMIALIREVSRAVYAEVDGQGHD